MPIIDRNLHVVIRHWLPIITFCPVNRLPDLLYVSLYFYGSNIPELYQVRKQVRKLLSMKKLFMEDAAALVADNFPSVSMVEVALAFNRHVVSVNVLKRIK